LSQVQKDRAWEETLRQYATLQRGLAGWIPSLLAWGCVDRRLENLAAEIDPLLTEMTTPRARACFAYPEEMFQGLTRLAAPLHDRVARLAQFGLPETLVHGDFSPNNIFWREGPLFYDWSYGAVAHPFFDVVGFGGSYRDPPFLERLRERYLEQWRGYASIAELRDALSLAAQVGPLHHALIYRSIHAISTPEEQWELAGGVTGALWNLYQRIIGGCES
jgi:hypothetical protein